MEIKETGQIIEGETSNVYLRQHRDEPTSTRIFFKTNPTIYKVYKFAVCTNNFLKGGAELFMRTSLNVIMQLIDTVELRPLAIRY